MSVILILLVFTGLALYLMKPEEREPLLRAARRVAEQARDELVRYLRKAPAEENRPRAPLPFVTWAIVGVTAWAFLAMAIGDGSTRDPESLVGWGASFGPRTTNGEWWRLVTATFVHAGVLHLAAAWCGLLPVAVLTERLAGHAAFLAVYATAGVIAHLLMLNQSAVSVSSGASASVFGVYGLLLATWAWRLVHRSPLDIRWRRVKRVAPAVGAFVVHAWWTDHLSGAAEFAGLAVGLACGLALAARTVGRRPAPRRLAVLAGATAMVIVALAVPVRGVADVRPEIRRVIASEERIGRDYEAAVARFRDGRLPAPALARHIEETILPGLQASRRRLAALERVPREHQALVATAEEYLRLREASWRERAQALRASKIERLRKADRLEREALDALANITEIAAPHE